MLRNYLKIALRSLVRNKAFTVINVLGLVLGISFSTMLYTYVSHELSYDSFHQKSDRTYRVLTVNKSIPDDVRTFGVTVPPLGPELVNNFPEVADMVRLHRVSGQVVVEIDGERFSERNYFSTEASFFNVFDFNLIEGDKATALSQPYSVVLSASTAKKYFAGEDAFGKTINLPDFGLAKVTGVMQDIPDNSHLQFDLLFSTVIDQPNWDTYLSNWRSFEAYTYVVLRDGKTVADIESKLPALMEKHWGSDAATRFIAFQPIEDIYLHSTEIQVGSENEHGKLAYVYIFSSMAVFLIIIAAINYINLTTAKAASRSKEIGIRKVAGAVKTELIFQFLTEAVLVTLVSMVLAIAMMDLSFPYFNSITGKSFDITFATMAEFMPSLLLITLIIGVIAGSYPAFYLAKLKPISILKGPLVYARNKFDLRIVLVVFQFTITIILIVSTLVIGNQMKYIHSKDIGFKKDQLMVVDINSGRVRNQFQAMKNEFAKIPGVEHVAVSTRVPGEWKNIRQVFVKNVGEATAKDSLQSYFMGFDEDMLATYRLQLIDGGYFSGDKTDSMSVLINSSAAEAMNLKSPVGKVIRIGTRRGDWNVRVIGVLNDFNFQSLHQKIAPIIIGFRSNPLQPIDYFTLKISGEPQGIIAGATRVCEQFDSETPIEYHFLDDQLNRFYVADEKAKMIFQMGGMLSIFVACLGLLGLASYHVERRTKELGIRKALGAGSLNLFLMVSTSFAKQVGLAFIVACPIAWYIMHQWLSTFEYRIILDAGTFVLAGVMVLFLALITVSQQSLRAARFNPIDSLRAD